MKIQGGPVVPGPDPEAGKAKNHSQPEAKRVADTASVSDLASAALRSRAGRVEDLKRQYEAGNYSVPAADLTTRIVAEHTGSDHARLERGKAESKKVDPDQP